MKKKIDLKLLVLIFVLFAFVVIDRGLSDWRAFKRKTYKRESLIRDSKKRSEFNVEKDGAFIIPDSNHPDDGVRQKSCP